MLATRYEYLIVAFKRRASRTLPRLCSYPISKTTALPAASRPVASLGEQQLDFLKLMMFLAQQGCFSCFPALLRDGPLMIGEKMRWSTSQKRLQYQPRHPTVTGDPAVERVKAQPSGYYQMPFSTESFEDHVQL